MGVCVWRATPDEAETVGALLAAFNRSLGRDWPSENAIIAGVERLIEEQGTEYLLAAPHDDAPPAGVAQLRFRHSVWVAAEDCFLEDLFVAEAARRQGVGRALVEATVQRARERDCRRILLDTEEDNAAALALYDAFGFASGPPGRPARQLFLHRRLEDAD